MPNLDDVIAELVHSLCCAITACKELNHVIYVLQVASNTLLDFKLQANDSLDLVDDDVVKVNAHRLAEITDVSVQGIRAAFFCSSFQELAEVLLSVVAPDWLDLFPDESTKHHLFYRWFNESPAPALLRCLCWHLSSVEPLPGHHHRPSFRNSLVLPLSANIAAELLTQRFAEENKETNNSNAIVDILEEGLRNPAAAEELAGLLAAVPDRIVLLPESSCPRLQAEVFIPYLVTKLVDCVVEHGEKYASIAAEVVSRAVQRGHTRLVASAVAATVLGVSVDTGRTEAVALILANFPASSALEKLLEALLRVLPLREQQQEETTPSPEKSSTPNEDQKKKSTLINCLNTLTRLLPITLWQQHSEIRLLFQDKLLTQTVLESSSLLLLLNYLDIISSSGGTSSTATTTNSSLPNKTENNASNNNNPSDVLAAATWRVASHWGEQSSIQRVPTPQQAYMTFTLVQSLQLLGKSRFEGYSGLLSAFLRGISARLASPREPVRRQAMRVGKAMSQILDSNAPPLFGDENIDLMVEEQWEEGVRGVDSSAVQEKKENNTKGSRAATKKKTKKSPTSNTTNGTSNELDEDYPMTETDSDDDDDDSSVCSTDSEFEQYDLEESDDDDVAKTNLQLRDIISLIQKSETDWKGHLRALRSAEALIRAAPDELTHYAVPLARTLLLTTAPAWADEELPRGEDPIEDQRFRSLVALTAAAPEPVGLSLAAEVNSPSLDVQQRSRALAVMAAAAQELSSPGSILKALEGGSDSSGTEITKSTQKYLQGEKVPGKAGRVVRASERSLAAAAAAGGKGNQNLSSVSKANRFPPIALKWAAALLKECDVQRHGVDLFGRDHFILGRLLATLGTFLEASQQSTEAAPLAAAVIELIKGQNVHDNEEPYVRKAALMAASHACMAVPAGSIATALLPAALSSATGAGAVARSSSSASTALVERLEWMRVWAEDVAQHDSDKDCRMMAAACRGLQGALSAEAMASLAASVSEQQSLGGGGGGASNVILPSFSGGVGSMPSVNVTIPRIESLNLK